ncbi:MAG: SAM-dependent methyltransferase [Chromatiales bacterium]|nr:SAM-dependent methyltransferase [Chromatiales bacterium]
MQTGFDLPPPGAAAREHSDRLRGLVEARIAASGGFLSFADYMDAVLYSPGLGYYSAGARKFGAAGDFVTAPELGSVFARCLARLAGGALRQLGGGLILEVGGGSGALAAELLLALRDAPPERYLMLDVSGDLRERQRQAIAARVPELLHRVTWLDALPADPWQGVLLANEVLDALPVERFRIGPDTVEQLGVQAAAGQLAWAARPAPASLAAALRNLEAQLGEPFAAGYTSEIGLRQADWLQALLASLARGLALFIDYGGTRREVYHPGRREGTLACHYCHRQHADPFFLPGLQDLTAWVDFSAVARAAADGGFDVAAYATQAHVLLASGILDDLNAGVGAADPARLLEVQEVQRLLLPGEMGERFKVLAVTRGFSPAFPLALRDLRDRL